MKNFFFISFIYCLLCWFDSSSQDIVDTPMVKNSLTSESPRYIIRIDRLVVDDMKLNDTLLVTIETSGFTIAGFDLKFGTASPFIAIEKVLPGEINDSCHWEYFKATPINTTEKINFPAELWQAVALAKITADTSEPVCFGFERRASLLKLVVTNEYVLTTPDTNAPIFFFWEDCTDNSLSDASGSAMIISNKVFDYLGTEISDNRELFPTIKGTPRQCINLQSKNRPMRFIDFHNGGVCFKLDMKGKIPDSMDKSGNN